MAPETPEIGMITSRKCPTCGQQALGYTTAGGTFYPLKEGDMVQVMGPPGTLPAAATAAVPPAEVLPADDPLADLRVWVPKALRGDRQMRCKYGVFFDRDTLPGKMTAVRYQMAYAQKLAYLLENEPLLPMVLDRYFAASNLATGSPHRMVENLLQELPELRRPAEAMSRWLEDPNEANLKALATPRALEDLEDAPLDDEALKKEVSLFSLEDFLESL